MSHERRFNPEHVERLEAPDRGREFPVQAILDAAGVHGPLNVADIGAGSGYFALPIGRRAAKVYAVDPSPELLTMLRGKLAADGAPANVELVLGEAEATGLAEASCDLIFLSAVWHEIDSHALHRIARSAVERSLEESGWKVVHSAMVSEWTYLVVGQQQA